MKTSWSKLAVVLVAALALPSLSYALDITTWDGMASTTWGTDTRTGVNEDSEVEAGALSGQNWDLEAIVLSEGQKTITLIGGFNWFQGYTDPRNPGHVTAGDLFLAFEIPGASGEPATEIGGDNPTSPSTPKYGAPYPNIVNDTFGYDYVFDVNWNAAAGTWDSAGQWSNTSSYAIRDLNPSESVYTSTASEKIMQGSSPVSYVRGSEEVLGTGSVGLARYTDAELLSAYGLSLSSASPAYSPAASPWHYAVTFGLSPIWADLLADYGLEKGDAVNLWAHITESCGNDNLIGYAETTAGSSVPEPSSIALLLLGVIGTVARKRFFA